MVNYCYIQSCGRNSRTHNHLNFYSFPKEKDRLQEWVKATGRKELLQKDLATLTEMLKFNRICSRHFTPSAMRRKKGLMPDAAPTLCLSGDADEEDLTQTNSVAHPDIFCNSCSDQVIGYRYKCVTCPDYDLCQKCEISDVHPEHYVLRIPKPMKYKYADNLTKRWRQLFKSEHAVPRSDSEAEYSALDTSSDDDQPITKYAKNYDSGVDLSDDVKARIRKEINRVLNLKPEEKTKKVQAKKSEPKKRQTEAERDSAILKRMKREEDESMKASLATAPEVAFADVNEIKDIQSVEMKSEFTEFMPTIPSLAAEASQPTFTPQPQAQTIVSGLPAEIPTEVLVTPLTGDLPLLPEVMALDPTLQDSRPVMHVKLSDDLQQLMIEVTSQNQTTIYKYQ